MPLGGLLPYDEEEERRRRMLTPGFNPALPEPVEAPRMPLSTGRPVDTPPPPARLPSPSIAPLGRAEELDMRKDFHMRETPGRGRSALTGALEGFLGGGGLLGAIAGGVEGAVAPRRRRERQFNAEVRPGLLDRFAMEDQEAGRIRQAEEDEINRQFKTAQIGELNRRNLPEPPKPRSPISSPRGLYDPEAGGIIPGTEPLPPPPRIPTPNFEFDVDRLPYDINNPQERKKFESLPRSKRVKPEKTGTAKPKEKQKFVPLSKIREYAKQRGISRDQAEAEARADGYTVIR